MPLAAKPTTARMAGKFAPISNASSPPADDADVGVLNTLLNLEPLESDFTIVQGNLCQVKRELFHAEVSQTERRVTMTGEQGSHAFLDVDPSLAPTQHNHRRKRAGATRIEEGPHQSMLSYGDAGHLGGHIPGALARGRGLPLPLHLCGQGDCSQQPW